MRLKLLATIRKAKMVSFEEASDAQLQASAEWAYAQDVSDLLKTAVEAKHLTPEQRDLLIRFLKSYKFDYIETNQLFTQPWAANVGKKNES